MIILQLQGLALQLFSSAEPIIILPRKRSAWSVELGQTWPRSGLLGMVKKVYPMLSEAWDFVMTIGHMHVMKIDIIK